MSSGGGGGETSENVTERKRDSFASENSQPYYGVFVRLLNKRVYVRIFDDLPFSDASYFANSNVLFRISRLSRIPVHLWSQLIRINGFRASSGRGGQTRPPVDPYQPSYVVGHLKRLVLRRKWLLFVNGPDTDRPTEVWS